MHIRQAKLADAEKISQLICELSQKYICADCSAEGAVNLINSMQVKAIKGYMGSTYIYHLAENHEKLVGVIAVRENSHLYHLFVDDDYHRQGIASELWQFARKACLSKGNEGLFTVSSSSYALPLYIKLGFVQQSDAVIKNGIRSIPMQLNV